jgi:hypothetical protein
MLRITACRNFQGKIRYVGAKIRSQKNSAGPP